ncbi:ABC transporter permease [Clostridium sp. WILCCON 0269]|uniref:ABC transporter permease n=1 Tax=Candidatus Clostridium eludens TaxID=3381663 RepID=A0ABW8SLU9_9CLOT
MKAILKNEIKYNFNSPMYYIVIGLFILVTSIYYFIGNVYNQSADLSSLFGTMSIILLFIVPILTAKTIAEDKRNGMEILLITSPTKLSHIVLVKFFPLLFTFLAIVGGFHLFIL